MEMGELVKTRWVSASGGDVGVELTAVVSIVMVGLWRYCVSMYTGPRCEAYTYARCLRTPEGFSSWSGEAMVAEAVGLGHKRGTQPQTRRSSILKGTRRPIARPMGWRRVCTGGAEGRRAGSRSSVSRSTETRRSSNRTRQLEVVPLGVSSHNGDGKETVSAARVHGRPLEAASI